MTAKELAIKNAYEECNLPFNENLKYNNGWLKIKPGQFSSKYDRCDLLKLTSSVQSIRPKSLSGIENNNGWVEITCETVLTEGHIYWFYNMPQQAIWTPFINHEKEFYSKEFATHYQSITKPKNPIY